MKKIILICPNDVYLESILSLKDIYIPVLVLSSSRQLKKIADMDDFKNKVGKVYYRVYADYKEFFEINKNNYNLTSYDIQKYRETQLKVERHLHRVVHDYNEIDYRYLIALEYWLDVFNSNCIDMVISSQSEHGFISDSIPFDIAKKRNIPVYINDGVLGNYRTGIFTIRNFNENQFLDISSVFPQQKLNFENYVYDRKSANREITFAEKNIRDSKFAKKILFDACKDFYKKLKLDVIKNFKIQTDVYEETFILDGRCKFKSYGYVKELKKIYNKLACNVVPNEKYIFFALHLEPEANTINRTKYCNQLFLLKMLSSSLPDGWKVYVKDHPYQFSMETPGALYNFKFIEYFRSKQFYAQILRIPNVKLINIDVPSEELISNSQSNATIAGTVLAESIYNKRPCMMFGGDASPIGLLDDIFKINSVIDIKNSISKLQNGFMPSYSDLESITSKYMYEMDYVNSEKFKKIIEYLVKS